MMKNNEITLFVSGDFCPIHRIEDKIKSNSSEDIFGGLAPYIENVDIAITNLECPLTTTKNPIKKTGPALKGLPKSASLLKKAGFNLVTLANNHIFDYGEIGLKDTINELDKNNISYVGADINGEKARSTYFINIKGFNIAIINIAENEWSTTNDEKAGANPINPIENFYQIKKAKEMADKIIVITHGGHERFDLPSPNMKSLFRFFIDAGADAVINHHTHYMSGYEIYENAPIFYSLGNFVFDNPSYRNSKWNIGISLLLNINKDSLNFEILSFDQCNDFPGINFHSKNENNLLKQQINRLNNIISSNNELAEEFKKHVELNKRLYTSYLEPIKNKYLLALQNRNILPRFFGKKNRLLLKNLIRCESHRELITSLLETDK